MPLTDEQLAEGVVRSFTWRRNWQHIKPGDRPRELRDLVRRCLERHFAVQAHEFGRRWTTVVDILRRKFGLSAAETKAVRKKADMRRAAEKAELERRKLDEPTFL